MLHDKIYAIISVIWEQDVQYPRLLVVDFSPADGKEVWVVQVSLDIIYRWESAPTHKLADTFHLGLWLKNEKNTLRDNNIHIDNSALLLLSSLLIFDYVLLLLTARVDGNPRVLRSAILDGQLGALVLHPDLMIVILEAEIESSNHWSCLLLLLLL